MYLTSPAFPHGSTIPQAYGRDFRNVNPPLEIVNIPAGTMSFTLFIEDPDVPAAAGVPVWDHWVLFNIPASITHIPEAWSGEGVHGKNARGEVRYSGPRPPDREHRYFFKLFALDCFLELSEGALKEDVIQSMTGHVLAEAELMGRYEPTKSESVIL